MIISIQVVLLHRVGSACLTFNEAVVLHLIAHAHPQGKMPHNYRSLYHHCQIMRSGDIRSGAELHHL